MSSFSQRFGTLLAFTLFAPLSSVFAQDVESRLDALEQENQDLRIRLDALSEAQEVRDLGDVVPPVGDSEFGLGPAASKIYSKSSGLSIGGYGEAIYQDLAGGPDEFDFLRAVLYFGYRFDENWVFNSELELEHASTAETGSFSVEFAYLDYLYQDYLNFRAGVVLVPLGFLNELHEPTTFLGATRPETETRIIPTTFRENGVGIFGDVGPISYRSYLVNGFDGADFSDTGLRGGRQRASETLAEDFAFVFRADWTDTPGLIAGGSVYIGDAGQGRTSDGLGDTSVSIYEVHAEWKSGGLWLRGLGTIAHVDDIPQLNDFNGFVGNESVGEELTGYYFEAGYDILSHFVPDAPASLSPFIRYEAVDTQADVPDGFVANPFNDFDVLTVGLNFQPIPGLVFKLDYGDYDGGGPDRWNAAFGYTF